MIAVFDNGAYVDTWTVPPAYAESDTIQASLTGLGHTVTTFTATNAAGISAALASADVLVLPEQEIGSLAPALDAAARAAITSFVSAGNGLIVSYDYRGFLSSLFFPGLSAISAGTAAGPTGAAGGTAFAGGGRPPFRRTARPEAFSPAACPAERSTSTVRAPSRW